VTYNSAEGYINCSCMLFFRHGIVCRHSFCVLKSLNVNFIPQKNVLVRWTKNAVVSKQTANYASGPDNVSFEIQSIVREGISLLSNDIEKMLSFKDKVNQIVEEFKKMDVVTAPKNKKDMIESLIGMSQPSEVVIQPPPGIRNKGCGTGKRLISKREQITKDMLRPKRLCKCCKQMVHHDSRNCPQKNT